MIIHDNVMLWIAYDPKKRFEKDLKKYWDSEIDYSLVENKIAVHLSQTNKTYFMLPAEKSKTKFNVCFLFSITTDVPHTRMKHRRYNYKKRLFINPEKIDLA
ncbi:DUF5960 family protein [Enterococcus faecium]|uniref:DUF5960 family protein n=1 Tax=Enterococcus faecium TaxID=1352 RepID=UPI00298EF8F7|nr:DUF5960 family protein [Enterococcus faecium]MDW7941209.1 DUF5960 family protein [Enterococcus faecium]